MEKTGHSLFRNSTGKSLVLSQELELRLNIKHFERQLLDAQTTRAREERRDEESLYYILRGILTEGQSSRVMMAGIPKFHWARGSESIML